MSNQVLLQCMFNQQRLQIMHLGVHHNEFTNAYLYAWENGVYPAMEDTDGTVLPMLHEAYPDFFTVKKEKVLKLLKILDDSWLDKKVPTFYELEDRLKVRSHSEWERGELISICRYFYLQGHSWDDAFWKQLITPMEHPSEASSIVRSFSRNDDICFM